ncbi:PD-(D/E)XK nuclease family protein, partial [uncultured Parolsenella sp.]
ALVADAYAVTRADRRRLAEALTRWAGSQIRAQALGHACVRAEVPFFRAVSSPLGEDLEGAIDLLACDAPGRGEALLVDYKTGDHGATYAQIRERHEMQARFYASVLLAQGFTAVTCAFVCVELEDETGEPVVVRYTF